MIRRAILALAALALGLGTAAPPAVAQPADAPSFETRTVDGRRVALVIGNSAYQSATGWTPLINAAHDAEKVADVLSDASRGAARFEVTLVTDGKRDALLKAIRDFALTAESADVAVIYYSGHGFEHNKVNYMVPVDAPGPVPARLLKLHYIDIEDQLVKLAQAKGINLVFLDACRNKVPIVLAEDQTKGAEETAAFGAIQAPQSIVFYATARGSKAFEEAPPGSRLSPFAHALAIGMAKPGLELSAIIPGVTDFVARATGGRQIPLMQGSWTNAFYFLPAASALATPPAPAAASAKPFAIDPRALDTVDEPTLIARVLNEHPPAEMIALANAGDPLAMYVVGFMYRYGKSVQADDAMARMWLKRAADTGNAAGQLEYGYMLLDRPEAADDRATARALYEKAAAQGYAKAKTHLASALLSGRFGPSANVAADRARARTLYEEAAAQGHPGALHSLAIVGDRVASIAGLKALSAAGNADGDHWLCELAMTDATVGDPARYCTVAAKHGYVDSQALLALLHARGKGSPAAGEARYWARIALAQLDLREDLRRRVAPLAN